MIGKGNVGKGNCVGNVGKGNCVGNVGKGNWKCRKRKLMLDFDVKFM